MQTIADLINDEIGDGECYIWNAMNVVCCFTDEALTDFPTLNFEIDGQNFPLVPNQYCEYDGEYKDCTI